MRRTAIAVALLVALMGFVLPVQARDGSDGVGDLRTATREATQSNTERDDTVRSGDEARTADAAVAVAGSQVELSIRLSGDSEVPAGSGDPDGWGTAGLRIRADEAGLCYSIRVSNLDPVVAAHIHVGGVDVAGPVVVDLAITQAETETRDGITAFTQCLTDLDATLLADIEANLAGYYVNVHTTTFPAGAVRGQLVQDDTREQ